LLDAHGTPAGVVGMTQDITESHVAREKLVQADKLAAIGTLAAGVAHEINNPIGFVRSNLNTMAKYLAKLRKIVESVPAEDQDEREMVTEMCDDFADAIAESIDGTTRVKNIVADLKSFSRVDRSEKEHANLNEGLESTLNIVWNELKYKCKVEKEYGELPDLYCVPNQLNQVFMNLLMNAGHAIETEGTIWIKTWADEDNVWVSIKDSGAGIPREIQSKIFEPFFTTKQVGKGTGLGLSLTFDIIEKHGGTIEVHSEPGQGAEFRVCLPRTGVSDE
jgi:signal transduction histidine kinase